MARADAAAASAAPAMARRRIGPLFERATETPSPAPAPSAASAASGSSSTSSIAGSSAATSPAAATGSDSARKGTDCFTTSTLDTTVCALTTDRGRVRTGECRPTQVASSACRPHFMCTTDTASNDVCMLRRDALDTGGIVVAVVFGALVALAIGALAFLCCHDRRQQKRFAAKAEAAALARAHTRKQRRAQGAEDPLMAQSDGGPGSPNPFHDNAQP